VREKLDIRARHVIMYAPTWRKGGEAGEIPFGLSACEFLTQLDSLCERLDAVMIFRLHMNSRLAQDVQGYGRILELSQKAYPEANELLPATDILVTDWSSIACDFYVLGRPTIFLDIGVPSSHSGEFRPIGRVGTHVANMDELVEAISLGLLPGKGPSAEMQQVRQQCYGDTLDGRSAARYDEVIRKLLAPALPEPAEG
jgi:CDP-glycerol glycerophosphotransferase